MAEAAVRVAFLGSGALGVPTLEALHRAGRVGVVVSQPDRPAGRGRQLTPTPVSAWALAHGLPLVRTEDANVGEALAAVQACGGPLVVVAFGQKLGPSLLQGRASVNLHPSALPRWRGAAPIQRAMLAGEDTIGVCAIEVADRMDAGPILGQFTTRVGALETAGEVLDRVAIESVPMMERVVEDLLRGAAVAQAQDETRATRAAKLSRSDAWVDFAGAADPVRLRIHGLQPWPGCMARVDGRPLRLLRVGPAAGAGRPGEVLADGAVACGEGAILPMEVQSPGARAMPWAEWLRGQRLGPGRRLESSPESGESA
ncbi:MAG: methionyl-tRNA formyltransferase [Planctomycetes bacterium]|nr:methionyl-tRNA formyltransferase [Planctomycetota bacterium]